MQLAATTDRVWVRLLTWSAIGLTYLVFMLRRHWNPADYGQQSGAILAMIHGHWSAVYPVHNLLTSPPGFLILAAPVVAILGGTPSDTITGPLVGMLSAIFVALSALRLARAVHLEPTPIRDRLLVAALLFGSPFTYSLIGAYHPEDLVAMGFLLLATTAAVRKQVVGLGLALAGAVLTRQWALLAAGPLLVYLGDDWRKATAIATAISAAVLAPFAILNPLGLVTALTATNGLTTGYFSVWRYAHLAGTVAYTVARAAPLACCVPTTALLRSRWRQRPPGWQELIGSLILTSAYRVVFDTDSLMYYLIPVACFLILIGLYDHRRNDRLIAVILVVSIQLLLAYEPLFADFQLPFPWLSGSVAAALELAFLVACAVGWRLTRPPAVDDGAPFEGSEANGAGGARRSTMAHCITGALRSPGVSRPPPLRE